MTPRVWDEIADAMHGMGWFALYAAGAMFAAALAIFLMDGVMIEALRFDMTEIVPQ